MMTMIMILKLDPKHDDSKNVDYGDDFYLST